MTMGGTIRIPKSMYRNLSPPTLNRDMLYARAEPMRSAMNELIVATIRLFLRALTAVKNCAVPPGRVVDFLSPC